MISEDERPVDAICAEFIANEFYIFFEVFCDLKEPHLSVEDVEIGAEELEKIIVSPDHERPGRAPISTLAAEGGFFDSGAWSC